MGFQFSLDFLNNLINIDIMSILIVENRALQRVGLESALREEGFKEIILASNYDKALHFAKEHKPKIIVMDISLSGNTLDYLGIEAAHEIQRLNKDVHFIYLTGLPITDALLGKIKETKSYTFLRKVTNPRELIDKIKVAPIENSYRPLKSNRSNLIFISYSHKDAKWMEEMRPFLEPLKRYGVEQWADTKIEIGDYWKDKIMESLNEAKAAILLLSIHFVNSDFITKIELPTLLKAAKDKGTLIIPVFVSHVSTNMLKELKLTENSRSVIELQGIPSPNNTIDTWNPAKRNKECWSKIYDFLNKSLNSDR